MVVQNFDFNDKFSCYSDFNFDITIEIWRSCTIYLIPHCLLALVVKSRGNNSSSILAQTNLGASSLYKYTQTHRHTCN